VGRSGLNNPRVGQSASLSAGTGSASRSGTNNFGSFGRPFGTFGSGFGNRAFGGFGARGFGFGGRGFGYGCWGCGWGLGWGLGLGWGFGWPYWGFAWGWNPYWYDPFWNSYDPGYGYAPSGSNYYGSFSDPAYSDPAYAAPSSTNGVFASPFNTTPAPQSPAD